MNVRSLPLPKFILRLSRRALFALMTVLVIIILTGWQFAYGLYRAAEMGRQITAGAPDSGLVSDENNISNKTPSAPSGSSDTDKTKSDDAKPSATTLPSNTTNNGSSTTKNPGSTNTSGNSSTPTNALGVPITGTVLTLTGLNYNITNYMPNSFGGIFNKSPYTLYKVTYPASLASDSITKGVSQLDTTVRSTPGQKIVLAHSQGAQVASRWMRQYANDPSAPGAHELMFVLFGNPLRSTGGYIIGRTEIGGTIGQPTPTTTKWPIIDVARRYDGWADWVHNTANQWAVDNAAEGKSTIHTKYNQIDLYAPTHTIWKSGNTTYVLTKEDDLPLWKDNSLYPLSVRTAMRAHIESAYVRPSNDPRVILLPIETQEWKDTLTGWGVSF